MKKQLRNSNDMSWGTQIHRFRCVMESWISQIRATHPHSYPHLLGVENPPRAIWIQVLLFLRLHHSLETPSWVPNPCRTFAPKTIFYPINSVNLNLDSRMFLPTWIFNLYSPFPIEALQAKLWPSSHPSQLQWCPYHNNRILSVNKKKNLTYEYHINHTKKTQEFAKNHDICGISALRADLHRSYY